MKMIRTRTRTGGPGTRLFFASDIHGSERCFRKWLNAIRHYRVDVLVLGGDITGKAIVPIVGEERAGWSTVFQGQEIWCRDEDEVGKLRQRIRGLGYYDVILSADEKLALDGDPGEQARMFDRVIEETLRRWMAMADERLHELNVECFAMLGNDDFPGLEECIRDARWVCYAEDAVYRLRCGPELVSFGYSTPTPWATPRELPENDIAVRLDTLVSQVSHPTRAIFNVHCPPKHTHLDQAPRLDANFKPVVDAAGAHTTSAGSAAVRAAIERYEPILGLHGHVHESPGVQKLGSSLCINPGSDYTEGVLRGAIVTIGSGGEVRNWQLTLG